MLQKFLYWLIATGVTTILAAIVIAILNYFGAFDGDAFYMFLSMAFGAACFNIFSASKQ